MPVALAAVYLVVGSVVALLDDQCACRSCRSMSPEQRARVFAAVVVLWLPLFLRALVRR